MIELESYTEHRYRLSHTLNGSEVFIREEVSGTTATKLAAAIELQLKYYPGYRGSIFKITLLKNHGSIPQRISLLFGKGNYIGEAEIRSESGKVSRKIQAWYSNSRKEVLVKEFSDRAISR